MFNAINSKDKSYLMNKLFIGIVEENKDKTRKGRVKIRVQGIYNDIPLEHIPWASPYGSNDGKSFSIPAIGKALNVLFFNGDVYEPQYIYSENNNINLQDKLDSLSDDEYVNFKSLIFDHRCQVSTDDSGLHLDYFENVIRIKNNSIDIKLKDNTQLLNLGHSDCNQEAVLGTNFYKWMDGFMQTLLSPSTLIGNLGAPILRPALDQKIIEYNQLRPNFVSNNVFIVNNKAIKKDDYNNNREKTPTKDDITKIDNKKILEKSSDVNKSEQSKKDEEKLQKDIKDDRTKEVNKTVENSPDETTIPPVEEEADGDEHDMTLLKTSEDAWSERESEKEKEKEDANNQMNADPYAGFWAGSKGQKAEKGKYQDENSQKGYGSYSTATESATQGGSNTSGSNASAASNVKLPASSGIIDKILKLGGDFAQKFKGKGHGFTSNCRVSFDHLTLPTYKNGVHGHCPQGAKAVLYGMTGDVKVSDCAGNGDSFSFKPHKGPQRSFTPTGYYNDKQKINLADYAKDKKKWQVGDIIAYGYADKLKDNGHIQIYTGYGWWSDFRQRIPCGCSNTKVADQDSVALWRMNDKGIKKVESWLEEIKNKSV